MRNGYPEAQGLYRPEFEHDACGIAVVADINGRKSHEIVRDGLDILANLAHRGGAGSDPKTGDGAGILLQLPDRFFRKVLRDVALPDAGKYGVGMLFMPRIPEAREACVKLILGLAGELGLKVLCRRDLPVNDSILGERARECRPHFAQFFFGRPEWVKTEEAFERSLYVMRKQCEQLAPAFLKKHGESFYFASLSSRTIVYKGMLTANQMDAFYMDLADLDFTSALALVHSRYSTNTFPSWERAHPYRFLIHNGEINTIRGNVNAMHARESHLGTEWFEYETEKILPIINENGSDSAMFDNCLEFLMLSGRPIEHAAIMMVPEPWANREDISEERKAFFEYHGMLMEPWDGPAAMAMTDGRKICALLDRNGLRPSRYMVTKDGKVILASETGVLNVPEEKIALKNRLRPGKMLLIDTECGQIINDDDIKNRLAGEKPYGEWIERFSATTEALAGAGDVSATPRSEDMEALLKAFGYTTEDIRMMLVPMARDGIEPVGSMGDDTPLAVLSEKPLVLFEYFQQLFAQVTNPPIDAIREKIVVSERMVLGAEGNLIEPVPEDARKIILSHPILNERDAGIIRNANTEGFRSATLSLLYPAGGDGAVMEERLERLFEEAENAIRDGATLLVLSDRGVDRKNAAIPSLLAVSALHQQMTRKRKRKDFSLILESGEPRNAHHFALLTAFGASAVYPYLAFDAIEEQVRNGFLPMPLEKALENYVKGSVKGMVKIISKMGISVMQSYRGSQNFEALGIGPEVIDRYFSMTASRIGGIGIREIAVETAIRHAAAFTRNETDPGLSSGGFVQWRKDGEYHMINPETVCLLQQAVRSGDYELFRKYTKAVNDRSRSACTLRGLLEFVPTKDSVPIEEVEPVERIVRRFKTGAMSYGSISREAHETLAIAMNRLGGKSNSGEGGEDPERFRILPNGDLKNSAIKQIASGRFGVTSEYLFSAKELQIKMAQGAKPGEGGQLPGQKVYPWIAKTRHSTPGVGLISPPPHHDIYSIEDLAELIFDLKNANKYARISVKLVSEAGVGTVAAGVAKGRADVVLISGYDGGTGASPRTSIRNAGLPWELGLAETQQTLLLNDLRSRITVEVDGKLLSGRDVIVAALLGAEEFGFATAPLVTLGCVMMRVCNLDTCPVGVATQNPKLRGKFAGKPEYVVNFMRFIAMEVREYMAEHGFRTMDEMIGRSELLRPLRTVAFRKAAKIDLSQILYMPPTREGRAIRRTQAQEHHLEDTLDHRILIPLCEKALSEKSRVTASLEVHNVNRAVGTQLGAEITAKYGSAGLPDDTIRLDFTGSAGQSFGAFIPPGLTLVLHGDANDYLGKGLSGGRIAVHRHPGSTRPENSGVAIGNTALYGATSGEAFIRGTAGERFCVRNSGASAVVEGCGDHGCEYMTGGKVIILGKTGRNFAAGMSGGIAYVYDPEGKFRSSCNTELVRLCEVSDPEEIEDLRALIEKHRQYTDSPKAGEISENFEENISLFVKIVPAEYERMLDAIRKAEGDGLSREDAEMTAFREIFRDTAAVPGDSKS
ncbi:MAG: glutamate synthase large subunit [Oscillospiraceae bacterium]|nr:glutamate synthase large subunit [Oscillospiraceae bacterium]